MRAHNNSNPAICVNNLMQIARGEVPYDRIKGLAAAKIDGPAVQSCDDIVEDATQMIETYEPRVEVKGVDVDGSSGEIGDYKFTARIKTKEADG